MIITTDKKTGKPSKIVSEIFQDKDAALSMKFSKIETATNIFYFNYPVLFQVEQEGSGTIIENELLDIYAGGASVAAAKDELSKQFEHNYKRVNELKDNQLSPRLLTAKQYLNFIIQSTITK